MMYEKGYHRIRDTFHGTMMYNKNDLYIGRCLEEHGRWGWEEIEKTLPYATGTVLDIGANIGKNRLFLLSLLQEYSMFSVLILP